jgi:hypothetical protein
VFDEGAFKGIEVLINEASIPSSRGVICYDITNPVYVSLTIVWSEDFVPILPYNPIVIPNIDGLAISNLPATTLFDYFNSLRDTLPSITCVSVVRCMENVIVGVVLSF